MAKISPLMTGNAHPVITLTPGTPHAVALVFTGAPITPDQSSDTTVPVVVWNGTKKTVNNIDVSGVAKDGSGTVIGSGDSQGFEPQNVAPGQAAFGYVYFSTVIPAGSDLKSLTPTYHRGKALISLTFRLLRPTSCQASTAMTRLPAQS